MRDPVELTSEVNRHRRRRACRAACGAAGKADFPLDRDDIPVGSRPLLLAGDTCHQEGGARCFDESGPKVPLPYARVSLAARDDGDGPVWGSFQDGG
jgi:hypothetical protein